MPEIPYIDEKMVKAQLNRIIPLMLAIDRFVPGSIEITSALVVLQMVVDDPDLRVPLIDLVNELNGAKAPV